MEIRSNKLVSITKEQAIKMQWSLIARWKPRLDVWPFTYGIAILGSSSAVSGMYINILSRKFLNLGRAGFKLSFVPLIIFPSTMSILAHGLLVSTDILIKDTACTSCLEVRAVVGQLGMGLLYPIFLAPYTAMYFAKVYYTYDVPNVLNVKQVASLWWKMTKPNLQRIQIIAITQALLTAFITYQEIAALEKIEAKLDSGNIVL